MKFRKFLNIGTNALMILMFIVSLGVQPASIASAQEIKEKPQFLEVSSPEYITHSVVAATLFCNDTSIRIPATGAAAGIAAPYPSNITVSGLPNIIFNVRVHLYNINHTRPDDIDILLVGPMGKNLIIMSDAGGSLNLENVGLSFDDTASNPLPDSTQIVSGIYQPTNYGSGDTFPTPAPTPSTDTQLAIFNSENPNGVWSLYVYDDLASQTGNIDGGWCLEISADTAKLQVAHLAPFAEDASVTITLNGAPALTDFGYGDSTGYIELPPGSYDVEVFPTGSATAAISATVELMADTFYTVAAVGDGVNQDLGFVVLVDDLTAPAAGKFHLRLGHLAPFASGAAVLADVRLQDGTPILENVDFGEVTGFIPLDAGTYDLKITTPGGDVTLIDPLPVTFDEGMIISAFASGEGSNQPLGVFALPAGVPGFFLPLEEAPVEEPPVAGFTAPATAYVGAEVAFTNTTTGSMPISYLWDFGDGITSTEKNPTYAFNAAGVYTVTLLAENEFGTDSSEKPILIQLVPPAPAKLQVAHLAPFAEDASVTITLNGAPALTDFGYGDSTGYIELPPGSYDVEVFPTGSATAAISATVELMADTYYTVAAVGDGVNQDLGFVVLVDDLTAPAAGKFHLRLGHLAPFASGAAVLADVRLQDGTPILENVDFGDVTGFIPLDAGTYDLKITTPGGDVTLIDPLPVTFDEGMIISAFASGEGSNQPLGVFALPAGVPGFFLPLEEAPVEEPPVAGFTAPATAAIGQDVLFTNTTTGT
jgi:PKD repeat protein/subtilisin-like proprotein convertase family protein